MDKLLEEVRDKLYTAMDMHERGQNSIDEVLNISRELDELIINYYNLEISKSSNECTIIDKRLHS